MNSLHILIIDDEPQMRKLLRITLESNGYDVEEADSGKLGLNLAASYSPDLILLDLGLPDEDGFSVLKNLREWYVKPVIIISVQSSEEGIIQALDNGANDYIIKPFRTGELLARIRSALRPFTNEETNTQISFDNLTVDFAARTVKKNGDTVKLTATEYALLSLLVKNAGRVLTHQYLLKNVWGVGYINQSQYLRVYIAQLRKKIENDPNRPVYIGTEAAVGYRFLSND